MLACGIVGLPTVGKTTLFNLLTGAQVQKSQYFSGRVDANVGIARVPDNRIDFLSSLYQPKKTTYAQIEVIDLPGLVRGASEGQGVGNAFLDGVRKVDALVQVVRAFRNDDVLHVEESIDPVRDMETINFELLMADLDFVDKRISRIRAGKKITPEQKQELAVLEKCMAHLEQEQPFSTLALTEEERAALQNYTFLTNKPMLVVVNLDEEQFMARDYPGRQELLASASAKGLSVIELCVEIEEEISLLEPADRDMFFAELGISEPAINRVMRVAYETLGLISFFTVGSDEVKAWTIRKGTTAKKAAGEIHSDLERGFIRAEVIKYDDLETLGSEAQVKAAGKASLEGKDYVVQDGDILHIRFNV
ncbi:MAG: redox-regulated ATPase YchF [Firmicutes bacterium]|nr:redox-regulated ATPase YchF [Bacillota bacterium]